MKAVLDSSDKRMVLWMKMAQWLENEGIPTQFEFKGSIVFCTNIDFEAMIGKSNALTPHFEAMIDRSLYLHLTLRTIKDRLCRIRQVAIDDEMLKNYNLSEERAKEAMQFVEENAERFYGLSIRLMHQVALCMIMDKENWRKDVEITKMRSL